MDAKQAMFEVDAMMGEFSGEIKKTVFCREMIQGILEKGGSLDYAGPNGKPENGYFWGLVYIIDELENGFQKLQEGVHQLFHEVHGNAETEPATENQGG